MDIVENHSVTDIDLLTDEHPPLPEIQIPNKMPSQPSGIILKHTQIGPTVTCAFVYFVMQKSTTLTPCPQQCYCDI
jgi:hypothetical protein